MFTVFDLCGCHGCKMAITFKWRNPVTDTIIQTIYSTSRFNAKKHILSNRFFKMDGRTFDIANVIGIEAIEE